MPKGTSGKAHNGNFQYGPYFRGDSNAELIISSGKLRGKANRGYYQTDFLQVKAYTATANVVKNLIFYTSAAPDVHYKVPGKVVWSLYNRTDGEVVEVDINGIIYVEIDVQAHIERRNRKDGPPRDTGERRAIA